MTRSLTVVPRPIRYAAALACAAAVLYGSLTDPGDGAPATLLGLETTIYLHLLAYAALAASVGYARLATDRGTLLAALAVATLFGAGVEGLQGLVHYRTASALDAVVNAAGAAVGTAAWLGVGSWFGAEGRTADRDDR